MQGHFTFRKLARAVFPAGKGETGVLIEALGGGVVFKKPEGGRTFRLPNGEVQQEAAIAEALGFRQDIEVPDLAAAKADKAKDFTVIC